MDLITNNRCAEKKLFTTLPGVKTTWWEKMGTCECPHTQELPKACTNKFSRSLLYSRFDDTKNGCIADFFSSRSLYLVFLISFYLICVCAFYYYKFRKTETTPSDVFRINLGF